MQLASCQHLAQAALELGLAPSTVSRRLQDLERRVGTPLLGRGRNEIQLTEEGRKLVEAGHPLIDALNKLRSTVGGQSANLGQVLRIQATIGFSRQLLARWMAQYQRQFPTRRLQLDVAVNVPSGMPPTFDLAIGMGSPPELDLVARKLASNERWLVASPDYLRAAGTPQHVEELAKHRCIVLRQDFDPFTVWRLERGREQVRVRVQPTLASNHGEIVRDWAIDGLGIAMRSAFDVIDAIDAGQLVRVLPHYQGPPGDLYALIPPQRRHFKPVEHFIQFLGQNLRTQAQWKSTLAKRPR